MQITPAHAGALQGGVGARASASSGEGSPVHLLCFGAAEEEGGRQQGGERQTVGQQQQPQQVVQGQPQPQQQQPQHQPQQQQPLPQQQQLQADTSLRAVLGDECCMDYWRPVVGVYEVRHQLKGCVFQDLLLAKLL